MEMRTVVIASFVLLGKDVQGDDMDEEGDR